MKPIRDRKITVRLTAEEFADAMTLAQIRDWRAWRTGTISDLLRALLEEAIQMNRLREAEQPAERGRKLRRPDQ